MATQDNEEDKKHKVKIYEQKERTGFPMWLWLLPLLALVGAGLWWSSRSDRGAESQRARTDELKPDSASPAASRAANTDWTATGIADTFRRAGRVSLGDAEVHFATGSAQLENDSQKVLDQVAQALKDNGDWRIRVEGHTDSAGPAANNEQLAAQRAESVVAYLASHGVDKGRLTPVREYGERAPKSDNATDMGKAENRRVELIKE